MKKLLKGSTALGVALFAMSTASHAQTASSVVLNGIGSSAMFLQLGEAAEAAAPSGLGATCLWTATSGVVATDTSSGSSLTDTGNVWIAWTPGTAGSNTTCGTTSSSTKIYAYLQTDSVVGDRCLFNGNLATPTCKITNTIPVSNTTANLIYPSGTTIGSTEIATLPTAIASALNLATKPTFAGTDIRPEDAEFAVTRATTACGTAMTQFTGGVGNATQYQGLGYANGGKVNSFYSTSTFNVITFPLTAGYTVTPLGATPIVVAVNSTSGTGSGFNSPNIKNLNRSTLALLLDGSIGATQDALTPGTTETNSLATTVLLREPLSGTYNTMEYNIPNNVELQTSQDVGANQPAATRNCSGSVPKWNAQSTSMGTLATGAVRNRAIGTGQELSELFTNTSNGLGYAFWSASNFKNATSSAKYLTIDGVDPIQNTYAAGAIPTAAAGTLGNVTLEHVADGTYPIWSLLRLVTVASGPTTSAQALATQAQGFVTASHPDFVPFTAVTGASIAPLAVERAHFTPPGIYASGSEPTPQNFGGSTISLTEVGGDVGGLPIPYTVDADFANDTGATFVGTTAPSSLRRQ